MCELSRVTTFMGVGGTPHRKLPASELRLRSLCLKLSFLLVMLGASRGALQVTRAASPSCLATSKTAFGSGDEVPGLGRGGLLTSNPSPAQPLNYLLLVLFNDSSFRLHCVRCL